MTGPARSVAGPLQRAVYARLTGDQPLYDLVADRIFDHVPEHAPHPYVTLGEAVETPDNTHDSFGRQVAMVLHVWSTHRGYAEALAIVARLVALLDHQARALAVDGHRVTAVRFESAEPVRDPDPTIRHVPARFRVFTEQVEE